MTDYRIDVSSLNSKITNLRRLTFKHSPDTSIISNSITSLDKNHKLTSFLLKYDELYSGFQSVRKQITDIKTKKGVNDNELPKLKQLIDKWGKTK
jgi:hypothetical protein